jgi:hypothetical protein
MASTLRRFKETADLQSLAPGGEQPGDSGDPADIVVGLEDLWGDDTALFDPITDEGDGPDPLQYGIDDGEPAIETGAAGADAPTETTSGTQGARDDGQTAERLFSREVVRVDSSGQVQFVDQGDKNSAVSLSIEFLKVDADTGALVLQFYTSSKTTTSSYTATLADGSPLPQWLKFDPISGTITGHIPNDTEEIELKIEIINSEGNTEFLQVTIYFDQGDKQEAVQTELKTSTDFDDTQSLSVGLAPLSEQILQAGQVADNYGADLIQALA